MIGLEEEGKTTFLLGRDSNQDSDWFEPTIPDQEGTQTHCLLIKTAHLVSGLTEAQILLSGHRRNSA